MFHKLELAVLHKTRQINFRPILMFAGKLKIDYCIFGLSAEANDLLLLSFTELDQSDILTFSGFCSITKI